MEIILISGLFSLTGILVSAGVSFLVSKKQLQEKYSEHLYRRRLVLYPQLYEIVSTFLKKLSSADLGRDEWRDFLKKLENWDSKHAILLSGASIKAIYFLRYSLREPLQEDNFEVNAALQKQVKVKAENLENALRTELGIYDQAWFHNPKSVRGLQFYNPAFRAKLERQALRDHALHAEEN